MYDNLEGSYCEPHNTPNNIAILRCLLPFNFVNIVFTTSYTDSIDAYSMVVNELDHLFVSQLYVRSSKSISKIQYFSLAEA